MEEPEQRLDTFLNLLEQLKLLLINELVVPHLECGTGILSEISKEVTIAVLDMNISNESKSYQEDQTATNYRSAYNTAVFYRSVKYGSQFPDYPVATLNAVNDLDVPEKAFIDNNMKKVIANG
ncbi:hypothetical protein BLOT_005109 [Blomia tropicalis]|nr:hypothetical protein BLOT_005109 [Blomia tropicalis]